MKKIVEFYVTTDIGQNLIGSITLNEKDRISFSENFPTTIKETLENEGMALGDKMWTTKDGIELLKRLRYMFTGSRLRASRVMEE